MLIQVPKLMNKYIEVNISQNIPFLIVSFYRSLVLAYTDYYMEKT